MTRRRGWVPLAVLCAVALSGCGWFHRSKPDPIEPQAAPSSSPAAVSVPPVVPAPTETPSEPTREVPASAPAAALAAQPAPVPIVALTSAEQGNAAGREAPGNLKATHELGCISSTQLSNEYTPADLYPAMGRCLTAGDTPRAVLLAAIAGVYVRFDTLRVADATAHDAGQVLARRATQNASERQRDDFARATAGVNRNANVLSAVCDEIRRVGAPKYFPAYMIEHGTGASAANDGSIWTPDFDPQAAWQSALDGYLHCPN